MVKILGLKHGREYATTRGLRYGHVMIMADQDHDGSHIKGLVINFFHHFWPSLLQIDGFIQEFITPIVKVTKVNVLTCGCGCTVKAAANSHRKLPTPVTT